jgi:transposase
LRDFWRRSRRGRKRAVIAVAQSLLVIPYSMLKEGRNYYELGADYFDRLNAEGLKRYLVKRIARLGYQATLGLLPTT